MKELISTRVYQKTKDLYWIPVYKRRDRDPCYATVKFGSDKPPPVPNPSMEWDHPTFREMCVLNTIAWAALA